MECWIEPIKIDNLSHSNQTFENTYTSHPQMQAIILFKNLDFFPTKSQNDVWPPPKPLKLNIFEFIYRGCQLLTRKCHRTKFFARLAARLFRFASSIPDITSVESSISAPIFATSHIPSISSSISFKIFYFSSNNARITSHLS